MIGIEGIDLTVTSNKLVAVYPWMWAVGLAMAGGGLGYVVWELRSPGALVQKPRRGDPSEAPTMGTRFLSWLTARGRHQWIFPLAGFAIILGDVLYNGLFTDSVYNALAGTQDAVAFLLGGVLLAYNFLPQNLRREKEFALFFSVALFGFLVVPITLIRLFSQQANASIDVYSATMLAPPIVAILRAAGVYAFSEGIDVTFELARGGLARLGITTSCSGIYSFTIFSAAFTAFIIVEFDSLRARVIGLLLVGIGTAYLANLLRMTTIVLVGHYTDDLRLQNALWVHANIGWVLFLGWIAIFWFLMFKYMIRDKAEAYEDAFRLLDLSKDLACSDCGAPVDPEAIPEQCRSCGRLFELSEVDEDEMGPEAAPVPLRKNEAPRSGATGGRRSRRDRAAKP